MIFLEAIFIVRNT